MYKANIYLYPSIEGGRRTNAKNIFTPHFQFYENSKEPTKLVGGKLITINKTPFFDVRIVVEDEQIVLGNEYSCFFEFIESENSSSKGAKFLICEANHVIGIGRITDEFIGENLNYSIADKTELSRKLNKFIHHKSDRKNDL